MTIESALSAAVAESAPVDEGDEAPGRVSRIMEIVEREASPVTAAKEPTKNRQDEEIEVDADLDESHVKVGAASSAGHSGKAAPDAQASRAESALGAAPDEAIIEVTDAELEAIPARPSQPSPRDAAALAARVQRSRPPERPSARPRSSAIPPFPGSRPPVPGSVPAMPGSLPPPRGSAPGFPAPSFGNSAFGNSAFGGAPSSAPPGSVDPWLLANRTLELSRAQARITELEEFIAFRDARIVTLEERLAALQTKLDELEKGGPRSRPAAAAAPKPNAAPPAAAPNAQSAARQPDAPKKEITGVRPVAAASVPAPVSGPAAAPAPAPAAASAPVAAPATASAPAAAPATVSAPESSENGADSEPEDDTASPESFAEPSKAGESTPGSNAGDLRSIAGIGPRFEAALRKQGITRLEQIAAWSEDDVRQVAKALKIPKSRIVKGRWIESAREAIGTRAASE